jgi:hypothetical protein
VKKKKKKRRKKKKKKKVLDQIVVKKEHLSKPYEVDGKRHGGSGAAPNYLVAARYICHATSFSKL